MFHSRAAIVAGALFLQSIIPSAAITSEQADAIKERLLHGPLAALTVTCPERWQIKSVACARAFIIINNELAERGHFGRVTSVHLCERGMGQYSMRSASTSRSQSPHWTNAPWMSHRRH
jgi:hypothetical protein